MSHYADAGIAKFGLKDKSAAYLAILSHLGHLMDKENDRAISVINDYLSKGDASQWPGPIVNLIAEKITPKDFFGKYAGKIDELTEAKTYYGLKRYITGDMGKGLPELEWVIRNGNSEFFEFTLSNYVFGLNEVTRSIPGLEISREASR